MNNILVIISGPSGGGKGTIIHKLLENNLEQVERISTYTTRSIRDEDIDKEQYKYISQEEFEELKTKGLIIAPNQVNGYLYGCPKISMDDAKYKNKILLIDVGIKGAEELLETYSNAISVYIIPPNKERLRSQMVNRDSTRWSRNLRQIEDAKRICGWLIINDNLDIAATQIKKIADILMKSGLRLERLNEDLLQILYKNNMHNRKNREFLDNFYSETNKIKENKDKELG